MFSRVASISSRVSPYSRRAHGRQSVGGEPGAVRRQCDHPVEDAVCRVDGVGSTMTPSGTVCSYSSGICSPPSRQRSPPSPRQAGQQRPNEVAAGQGQSCGEGGRAEQAASAGSHPLPCHPSSRCRAEGRTRIDTEPIGSVFRAARAVCCSTTTIRRLWLRSSCGGRIRRSETQDERSEISRCRRVRA